MWRRSSFCCTLAANCLRHSNSVCACRGRACARAANLMAAAAVQQRKLTLHVCVTSRSCGCACGLGRVVWRLLRASGWWGAWGRSAAGWFSGALSWRRELLHAHCRSSDRACPAHVGKRTAHFANNGEHFVCWLRACAAQLVLADDGLVPLHGEQRMCPVCYAERLVSCCWRHALSSQRWLWRWLRRVC